MPVQTPPSLVFDPARADTTLFEALIRASRRYGPSKAILEDADRKPLSYRQLLLAAQVIGGKLIQGTRARETIGILLPNANGLVITLFGLNAYGRVAALLNFTSGIKNLVSAVRTAEVARIVTSRRFIETAKLDDVVIALSHVMTDSGPIKIIYLEDVRGSLTRFDKVRGAVRSLFRSRGGHAAANKPAAVLFTSGTEGTPKGVVLSNRNIVVNALQIFAHGKGMIGADDIALNPLPMFHSFGLTAGTIMPLLHGMRVVLYPSPLQYRQIPTLIRDSKATLLLATDTFVQGYGRAAGPGDLDSVRLVVCGAERVKDATRAMWSKWKTTLLEGYGATECSPVIACNTPLNNQPGTVGSLLPGIRVRIEPVDGIQDGGRLLVHGPNVMLGYMHASQPGVVVPPQDGWHDTGDIVTMDERGTISIKGRAKRFAKIGGEMVSLAAVEAVAANLWPQANHIVVSIPDSRKGEQLVLVTEQVDADKAALLVRAKGDGFPELWVPRAVLIVPQIPVLGSGKVDYASATDLAFRSRALL